MGWQRVTQPPPLLQAARQTERRGGRQAGTAGLPSWQASAADLELLSMGLTPSARCRFSRSSPLQQQEGCTGRRQGMRLCQRQRLPVMAAAPAGQRLPNTHAHAHTQRLPTCQLLPAAGLGPSLTCTPPPHPSCSLRSGSWSERCRRAAPGSPCRRGRRAGRRGSSERAACQSAATSCQPAMAPTPVRQGPSPIDPPPVKPPPVNASKPASRQASRQASKQGESQGRKSGKKGREESVATHMSYTLAASSSVS